VNPTPPDKNPVYAALSALAPPNDWASISPAAPSKPNRVRVKLKLRRADITRTVELKLGSENEVDDVWHEFSQWYAAYSKTVRPSAHEHS